MTICDNAFYDIPIDGVVFPKSLVNIGEESFSHTNIRELVIPPNVECIDRFAFSHNDNLEKIVINSEKNILYEFMVL